MIHPLVKDIATKIANKNKSDYNIDLPVESIIELVIKEIDVPVYSVKGVKSFKQLTLSEALRQSSDDAEIIHLPTNHTYVKFMLQAYELYACKGFLGNPKNTNPSPVDLIDVAAANQSLNVNEGFWLAPPPIMPPVISYEEEFIDEQLNYDDANHNS